MAALTLQKLEKIFTGDGYDCVVIDSDVPILQVFLGADHENRERMLTLYLVDSAYGEPFVKNAPAIIHVHFQAILSLKVEDSAMYDMGCLLHFLNSTIELPGFQLDEAEGTVTYRYTHITEKGTASITIIKAIVGAMSLALELFEGVIRQVASGAMTYSDVLEMAIAQAEKEKSEKPES